MKIARLVRVSLLLAAVVLAIAGCGLLPVSIEQRIATFVESLNTTDRSTTYLNFSPTISDYGVIADGSWWDGGGSGYFPTDGMDIEPYDVVTPFDASNPAAIDVTINGPSTLYGTSKDFRFVMVDEGSGGIAKWMIKELYFWDTSLVPDDWTLMVQ